MEEKRDKIREIDSEQFIDIPNGWYFGGEYPLEIYAPDKDETPTITVYVGPASQEFAAEYVPKNRKSNSTGDSPFVYPDLDEIAKWIQGKIDNHTLA